jgi:hypothetical protein
MEWGRVLEASGFGSMRPRGSKDPAFASAPFPEKGLSTVRREFGTTSNDGDQ